MVLGKFKVLPYILLYISSSVFPLKGNKLNNILYTKIPKAQISALKGSNFFFYKI